MKQKYPFVTVLYKDTTYFPETHTPEDDLALMGVWLAGWIIKQDEESISVAQELFDEDDRVKHVTTVAKSTIVEMRQWTRSKPMEVK